MKEIIFLSLAAAVIAFGRTYARYFSASWGFLIAIIVLAVLAYPKLRKRFFVRGPLIAGRKANPMTLAVFVCVAGSYCAYCLGALITGVAGTEAMSQATVLATIDALRCDHKAEIRLEDDRTACYCAGQTVREGTRVHVRTRSTPLGVYAMRV